jgi:predicted O-methyltransferase YrrM
VPRDASTPSGRRYGEVKHLPMSPVLREYLLQCGTALDPVQVSLSERTAALGNDAAMLVPAEEAALLTILARLLAAKTAVDIGTFTGLSALAMAQGLAPGGRVITCDVTDKWSDIAREYWERAGMSQRIDFQVTPADDLLAALPTGTVVDIAFLDADKEGYAGYYGRLIPLLRPGGLLLADNVLLNGYVLAPELAAEGIERRSAQAIRAFNAMVAADERVECLMLPIADGLTIVRKT